LAAEADSRDLYFSLLSFLHHSHLLIRFKLLQAHERLSKILSSNTPSNVVHELMLHRLKLEQDVKSAIQFKFWPEEEKMMSCTTNFDVKDI